MRHIEFDTSGVSTSCPKSDCGLVTSSECQGCTNFKRFEGFDAVCSYEESDIPEWVIKWWCD